MWFVENCVLDVWQLLDVCIFSCTVHRPVSDFFFSFSFYILNFFKRVENPCFRCLTTYFQLYSTQAFSDFFSNRYFIGLLDCCLSRIGERIQMAPLHYLCWYIYACYIEFQTYFRYCSEIFNVHFANYLTVFTLMKVVNRIFGHILS